ncbi:MAG: hypothetical protein A2X25_14450 [Chloroflexi bacterium GWB2_49_20]|nr:MAG: hypothetical protein A2X25_14450 [Chloroflexi bacterium GWB2_49_20]OGN77285.1 MAG: hypothetical protein A2X26_08795 [Chloroflexi bacterium GWC2_49_37]OGN84718.1 MAG: hypothetical protein A2X27_15310 [Chloroflexi bacterium GWD2_49_16]HBG75119.1 hypothetical protein [Anaerolineae bacterium]HCC78470.1 hypothetical protein [Anaerolineae bacterium]
MPANQRVKGIVTNHPYLSRPANRKPINCNQDHESIAKDIALKYGGDVLIWEYDPQSNSLFVMFTNHRKFRLFFSQIPERGEEISND